jgi:molybdate transport system ATP-binding protein
MRRAPAGRIGVDDVIALLGIATLLDRRPHTLSGGERQRVAIGRALLSQPRLLVMDEPLASLDAERKAEILPYLARLKSWLGLPILYVSHALDEVARLADTLVLIRAGRVLAAGPLTELASRADLPIAAREDAAAILPARVMSHDPETQLTALQAAGRVLLAPLLAAAPGARLRARIPAREVILATEPPGGISVHNVIPGVVRAIVEDARAHASLVEVMLDGAGLLARVTPDAVRRLGLAPGKPVLALVKAMAIETLSVSDR